MFQRPTTFVVLYISQGIFPISPRYKIACGYDCRRVLKHVSKAYDIFHVVRITRNFSISQVANNGINMRNSWDFIGFSQ